MPRSPRSSSSAASTLPSAPRVPTLPPLLLRSHILLSAPPSSAADPSSPRLLRWPDLRYQLRYQILHEDGVPVSVLIPRQSLTAAASDLAPLPLPRQSFRLLSTFFAAHGNHLRRRLWIRCPGPRCRHHRARSLYLYHPSPADLALSSSRFWCTRCFAPLLPPAFTTPSSLIPDEVYRVAQDPLSPEAARLPVSIQLRAIPVWLRWRAGRKWQRPEKGVAPVAVTVAAPL